jgi:hypothetical protein
MIYDLPTTVQSLPVRTEATSSQACPRKEFNGLLIKSVSTHEEINLIPTVILGRSFTRSHILPPTYPNGSQVAAPTFPRRTFSMPYPASLRQELYVRLQQSRVHTLSSILASGNPYLIQHPCVRNFMFVSNSPTVSARLARGNTPPLSTSRHASRVETLPAVMFLVWL